MAEGGFNVNVKGSAERMGGYIASTADASQNTLATGTLTYSDLATIRHPVLTYPIFRGLLAIKIGPYLKLMQ